MSWAVEKILQLATHHEDLQLASTDFLKDILNSIMTVPQDWPAIFEQVIAKHEGDRLGRLVCSIGENMISTRLAKRLALKVETVDALSIPIFGDASRVDNNTNTESHSTVNKPILTAHPDSAVAVTGIACKFARADSLDQLWEILETGTSLCRDLPNDRFPDWRFDRRSYPKKFKGNFIEDVDAFDH